MYEEWTWILFCWGSVVSGREEAKFHSSSPETPLLADGCAVLGGAESWSRSRRLEDAAAGLGAAGFCWNGEEARGLGETSAANGSAWAGGAAVCFCCGTTGVGVADRETGRAWEKEEKAS